MDSDLIDMIAKNESPTDIHSKIKDILFAKSAENIDTVKPAVTSSLFGGPNPWADDPEATADAEDSNNSEIEASQEEEPTSEVDSETPSAELETDTDTTEEEKPEA
tara:strand:+ start:880 stop:1197 length:318 start_codon:yes stop_codon:yes gene_type:complete